MGLIVKLLKNDYSTVARDPVRVLVKDAPNHSPVEEPKHVVNSRSISADC